MQCITQLSSQTSLTDVFDFGSHEKPLLMIYSEDGTSKSDKLSIYIFVNFYLEFKIKLSLTVDAHDFKTRIYFKRYLPLVIQNLRSHVITWYKVLKIRYKSEVKW